MTLQLKLITTNSGLYRSAQSTPTDPSRRWTLPHGEGWSLNQVLMSHYKTFQTSNPLWHRKPFVVFQEGVLIVFLSRFRSLPCRWMWCTVTCGRLSTSCYLWPDLWLCGAGHTRSTGAVVRPTGRTRVKRLLKLITTLSCIWNDYYKNHDWTPVHGAMMCVWFTAPCGRLWGGSVDSWGLNICPFFTVLTRRWSTMGWTAVGTKFWSGDAQYLVLYSVPLYILPWNSTPWSWLVDGEINIQWRKPSICSLLFFFHE